MEILPDPSDPSSGEGEVSTAQRAFAAYADAWKVREATGDTSEAPLIAELERRPIPPDEWDIGTDLRTTLDEAWQAGRPPHRLHGAVLKYRWRRIKAFPREVRELFRDPKDPPGSQPRETDLA